MGALATNHLRHSNIPFVIPAKLAPYPETGAGIQKGGVQGSPFPLRGKVRMGEPPTKQGGTPWHQ